MSKWFTQILSIGKVAGPAVHAELADLNQDSRGADRIVLGTCQIGT